MEKTNYIIYGLAGLFGLYLLFLGIQMKISGKISDVLLPPEEIQKIKDIKGYIRYTIPAMLSFSGICILVAIAGCLKETGYLEKMLPVPEMALRLILLTVFLSGLGFFIFRMRKGKMLFG